MRAGDAAGAVQAYRAAARLSPRSAAIQVGLARALVETGDREGAAAAYQMALSLEPGRPDATRELASLQPPAPAAVRAPSEADLRSQARAAFASHRFAEAERLYGQLTALVPGDARLHAGLGASLLAQRRVADAITAYRLAADLDPGNAGFWAALGSAYEAAGNAEEARGAYQRALLLDPRQRHARERMAHLGGASPNAPAPTPPASSPAVTPVSHSTPESPPAASAPAPAPPPPPAPTGPTRPAAPSRDDIVRTLGPFEERLESCAPTIDQAVTFRIRIQGGDGRVTEVEALGDLAGSEEASCMESQLGGARFPRFTQESIEIRYPFALHGPRADEAAAAADAEEPPAE